MVKHFDEARKQSIEALKELLRQEPSIERLSLIDDLFGRIRVVIWGAPAESTRHEALVRQQLRDAASEYWTDEIWRATGASSADKLVYDRVWNEGRPISDRLRLSDRIRNRTAWFKPIGGALWDAFGENAGPPIIVFYSFKGGVGRTTALASFAIQRARAGDRVAVLDLDLDAPG